MWVGASLNWCVTYRFFFNILDCFLTFRVTTSSRWREGHSVYLPQEQRPDGVAFHIFSRSLLMLPAPHPVKPCLSFLRGFCKSLLWAHIGGPADRGWGEGNFQNSNPASLPPLFLTISAKSLRPGYTVFVLLLTCENTALSVFKRRAHKNMMIDRSLLCCLRSGSPALLANHQPWG